MGVAEKDDTIVYMCVLNQTGKRTDDIMVSLAAKDGNLSKKFYMMQMPEIRIQYNKNSLSLSEALTSLKKAEHWNVEVY